MINPGQDQNVGIDHPDDALNGFYLWIAPLDIAQQQARTIPRQVSVEKANAQAFGPRITAIDDQKGAQTDRAKGAKSGQAV